MKLTTIKELDAFVQETKRRFELYIVNPAIPLVTRWAEWVEAPEYLKNHEDWLQPLNAVPNAFAYDGSYERYQKVSIDDDTLDHLFNVWGDEEPKFSNQVEFQEEILAKNLGSFVYDW